MEQIAQSLQQLIPTGNDGSDPDERQRRGIRYLEVAYNRPYCPRCQATGTISEYRTVETVWGTSRNLYNVGVCPECLGNKDPEQLLRARLRASGIDPVWIDQYRLDNFNPRRNSKMGPVFRRVAEWSQRPSGTLLLVGGVGLGKTHLAIAAALETVKLGLYVRFTTTTALLDRLRESYNNDAYAETYRTWCSEPDVLVIDDWGAEKTTEYATATLENAIAERLLHEKSMLITSNLSPENLPDRVRSRMMDRSKVSVLICSGNDMRMKQEER